MRVPAWIRITAALWAAVFLCVALTLPPAARETSGPAAGGTRATRVRVGAFHIHTTASDGGGTRDDVARAAAAAGLDFVILTDHGDGTAPPAGPEYKYGVLILDGVEVTTTRGHYAAVGLAQSPYPLGGPPYAVIEDVARLGGFGVAAHPDSSKDDLRWRDWAAPIDGLEVFNGDSAWRDERAFDLARALIAYPFRPAQALATFIQRPAAMLGRLDSLNRGRRVISLAAADAHGRLPLTTADEGDSGAWAIPVPSYRQAFSAVANVVEIEDEPTGDPAADARAILDAVRRGRVTAAVTALAAPASLSFVARAASGHGRMGDRLRPGAVTFEARTPDVASADGSLVRLELRRNGEVAARADGPALSHRVHDPEQARGVWRVEASLAHWPGVPWLLGNPIVLADGAGEPAGEAAPAQASLDLLDGPWAVEKHAASEGAVVTDAGVRFSYRLGDGAPSGQFAAAVRGTGSRDAWARVVVTARANEPTRLWIQLRLTDSGSGQRWGRSIYLDEQWREISVPLAAFEPLERGAGTRRPVEAQVRAVLFVVDTVNSGPGRAGRIAISSAAMVR